MKVDTRGIVIDLAENNVRTRFVPKMRHYETCLFKYNENFTSKTANFQIKNSDIFHISAQNIDCGYSLEPPR